MKINKIGILLFIISSFISITFLEVGLRLSGYVFENIRSSDLKVLSAESMNYDSERDYEKFMVNDEKMSIWSIGDSFTNAGNVSAVESYPSYLFQILNRHGYNYSVLNLGQCEDPTWGVYQRLEKILAETERENLPAIVIVLTGAADSFYYTFSGLTPPRRDEQKVSNFSVPELPWYKKLRVYKVLRHIKTELVDRRVLGGDREISNEVLSELANLYETIKTNKESGTLNWPLYEEQVTAILDDYRQYLDGEKNEFSFDDKARFIFNTIIIPRIRGLTGQMRYDEALSVLIEFGGDYPLYFWNDERNAPISLHIMSQLMLFQSKYTSKDIENFLLISTQGVEHLRSSELYKTAENFFLKKKNIESEILKARTFAWRKILELSKKYNFKVMSLTYASDFKGANDMATSVSKYENAYLVDNFNYFRPLIKKYGKEKLFADDNHFQPLGYEYMAKNIFENLKKYDLIK
ncbi:hypothetical protein [Halobacteriovorax sp.]|uniref:hypothetical protein n=1 Tax=Halobacteriovorax sp. TaxID=2020862 RepID=UPI0035613184